MSMFYHCDHTRQMIDARNAPSPDIDTSSVFYLAYRVKIGNAIWYHHAILLADNVGQFLAGARNLQDEIRNSVHPSAMVSLLFVRSLFTEDALIIESAFGQNIFKDITAHLATGRETHDDFMVFGLIGQGEYRMTLMNLTETDACSAIASVHAHIRKIMNEPFAPLDVCLIHPVAHEFLAQYQATAGRIMAITGEFSGAMLTRH